MRKCCLLFLTLLIVARGATAWSTCPQEANDRGNCDTMYTEAWAADVADTAWARSGLHFVKVPIYITNDVNDEWDSIQAFVIPLCYTHTNPSKYCSVTGYWNEILWNENRLPRSIFRHLPANDDPQVHNWMMDLFDIGNGDEWDYVILDLDGTSHFWLTAICGSSEPRFSSGSKILLATLTMKMQDTMNICIDTCFWPPASALAFEIQVVGSGLSVSKKPRSGTGTSSFQVCFPNMSDVKELKGSDEIRPGGFSLSQNYPNPFNPVTNFEFHLSQSSHVKIEIFNIVGQKVKVLVDEDMKPGVYMADWNSTDDEGKQVASGIYFYRMQAGDYADIKKMVLMK